MRSRDLILQSLQTALNLLGLFNIVPEAIALTGSLQLFDLLLGGLQLQRAPENLQRGLCIIELYLIFFKFKHFFNHFQFLYSTLVLYTKSPVL